MGVCSKNAPGNGYHSRKRETKRSAAKSGECILKKIVKARLIKNVGKVEQGSQLLTRNHASLRKEPRGVIPQRGKLVQGLPYGNPWGWRGP